MKTDPLRETLQALPELPPPDALWPRLRRGQRQRQIRQRLLLGSGLAVAALALFLPWTDWTRSGPRHDFGSAIAQSTATNIDPGRQLAAVDRALQAAYAQGASDAELAPLWDIRRQLATLSLTASPSS